MTQTDARRYAGPSFATARGLLAACTAALLAGACSGDLGLLGGGEPMATALATDPAKTSEAELKKAIEYWGGEHKAKPHDLTIALNLARNLKAAGEKQQAFAIMQSMALTHGDSKELASEYGRLALDLGQVQIAQQVLAMADDPIKPDWRVISAMGTVQAKQGKYADAIPYYERALALSPDQPSVLNNLAMTHAANGEPAKAEEMLRHLLADDKDGKIRRNLAIVLGLRNKHDEAQALAAGSDQPTKTFSDNADYIKQMVKAPVQAAAPSAPAATPVTSPAAKAPAKVTSAAWITAEPKGQAKAATASAGAARTASAKPAAVKPSDAYKGDKGDPKLSTGSISPPAAASPAMRRSNEPTDSDGLAPWGTAR